MKNYPADIRRAFEMRGYQEIANAIVASAGDVWYRHKASTAQVEHVAYLSYKPTAKAYSVHVGASNADARKAVEEALPRLSQFIEPGYLASPFFMKRPSWQIFDAGRALKWESVFIIPNPRDRDSWPALFDSLFSNFLMPNFFSIHDARGIHELLLRNDAPFEWFMTNPVLRIAEIAALGKIARVDRQELINAIDDYSEMIVRRLHGSTRPSDVINYIFNLLY